MTIASISLYDDSDWYEDSDDDAELFIESKSGRIARKYGGCFDDAQDVIEWAEKQDATAELLPFENADTMIVRVFNANGGAVVDLKPEDYLVLEKGAFFTEDQYLYEPNPNHDSLGDEGFRMP